LRDDLSLRHTDGRRRAQNRGERPLDPIEALLDPFSVTTKRWIAILWTVSAITLLLAISGFPPVSISFAAIEIAFSPGTLRWALGPALLFLGSIVLASATGRYGQRIRTLAAAASP
jgi:hypothetical protein